jgi:hypothetical protein
VQSISGDDASPTLPEFLARRARSASDGRLALDTGGGALLGASALIFHPPVWVLLACAGLCLAAFGAWGILDREAAAAKGRRLVALRAGRGLAVLVGIVAALGVLLAIFGYALGRWIS